MNTMKKLLSGTRPSTLALAFALLSGASMSSAPPCLAEKAVSAPAPARLNIGDLYGGGRVAYILKQGETGYVAGETHGLIVAVEDLGQGSTWENARKLCRDYRGGGHSDWYLPDKKELNMLFVNKSKLGGFEEHHYYWSSSDSDTNDAWDQNFSTGKRNLGYKTDNNFVRAVREF